ncbi:MAG: hypothetical protein UHE86_00135 [Acutalibacteraceae bacterium]|nr:hypothetical protein [Acutalibacteraceae bacterium]
MGIRFEKEVCQYLSLPSIPLKEWDGKTSFKDGVAVTKLLLGDLAYAVCTFNADTDKEPRIKKVFAEERFSGIDKIYVVPSYMDTKDIENADLDEQSKDAAKRLADEAEDLTQGNEEEMPIFGDNLPEYFFDHIHNDEEAIAFITAYNRDNNIRGAVPSKHETIVMRLGVIYNELQKKNK